MVEGSLMQDRAAMQVEITRLRRTEAKVDGSMREAVMKRIRELQIQLQGSGPRPQAGLTSEMRKTA
jgi:hypothetical protein